MDYATRLLVAIPIVFVTAAQSLDALGQTSSVAVLGGATLVVTLVGHALFVHDLGA